MKKIFCLILAAAMIALILAACGGQDQESSGKTRAFTVVDKMERKSVTATFLNSDGGDTVDVEMKKADSADSEKNL